MAVALFVGMLDTPAVSTGGGGGGSQSDLPWRDKDDDDLQWARRCARAATLRLGKKPRTGLKDKGYGTSIQKAAASCDR